MNNIVHLDDCMNFMSKCKDNEFQLSICDPPYGIYNNSVSGFMKKMKGCNNVGWDVKPDKKYFDELFRISKNQIVWGGNYFFDYLGNTKEPIVWNKMNGTNFFGDGEMAWSSFTGTLRIFNHQWCGAFKDSERGEKNFHPTGKPIELYRWLLKRYAKHGYKIFDSHVGSGSSRIACHELGFDFTGCELNKEYYDAQEKRYFEWKKKFNNEFYIGDDKEKNLFNQG
jgi:site-specific DNA-methyltransferase (adenine-specific)